MRIGIDCLTVNPDYKGGINTYLFGLINGFAKIGLKYNYIIFCTSKNKGVFEKYIESEKINLVIIDNYKPIFRKLLLGVAYALNSLLLWRSIQNMFTSLTGMTKLVESKCDILYTATTTLNFYNLKIPTILSMHDIQQYHYPEFFTKHKLRTRRLSFENSAKCATYFQASSQFIKNDLLVHFPFLKEEQIVVIPEGVEIEEFSNASHIDIIKKYNLPAEFLFFPAQLWKHKNHITVLKSLKQIEEKNKIKIPLVLTGAKSSSFNEVVNYIERNNMDYIYYLGIVEFPDLLALYKKAKFLITAVLYESSSLPILEAVASSTAIIASKTPPNIEMSKSIQMSLFEPLDVDKCSETIKERWLTDKIIINKEIDNNCKNISSYSWENIAKKYLNFVEEKIDVK